MWGIQYDVVIRDKEEIIYFHQFMMLYCQVYIFLYGFGR